MQRRRSPRFSALATAAVVVGLVACSASARRGTRVELVSSGSSLSAGEELSTPAAGRVRVDELRWTLAEVELLACRGAWQRASDWLIRSARAHGLSTPTLLAVPTVESADSDTDTVLGQMSPPAGRYCGLRYQLGRADADAEGLEAAPTMLGRSLLLRGAFERADGELEAIALVSSRELDVELSVELELSADSPERTLRFTLDAARLFQDVDFTTLTETEREQAVLDAFLAAVSVRTE